MKYLIIVGLLSLFISCTYPMTSEDNTDEATGVDYAENYTATFEDLLGREFYSLDETVPHNPDIITTRLIFDSTGNFQILEDVYYFEAYDHDNPVYQYTQQHAGAIVRYINSEQFQVLDLNIRRLNLDGSEVTTGYKYYSIERGTYSGQEVLKLVEVDTFKGWDDNGNVVYTWGATNTGDTALLKEIAE